MIEMNQKSVAKMHERQKKNNKIQVRKEKLKKRRKRNRIEKTEKTEVVVKVLFWKLCRVV